MLLPLKETKPSEDKTVAASLTKVQFGPEKLMGAGLVVLTQG